MEEIMILAVLFILYVAIGLMIESVLNAFLDEVGEHLFMFTVLLWPLLIIAGVIGLIMWLFITAGNKIGKFLRRKFDDEK
jgi:hypothetical protein